MNQAEWDPSQAEKRKNYDSPVIFHTFKKRIENIFSLLKTKNKSLLEVGAGDGYYTIHLNKHMEISLCDKSSEMLFNNPLKEKAKLSGLPSLEYPNNSFETVFMANVLHHLDDEVSAIRELKRISTKYIISIEPNRNNPINVLVGLLIKNERKSLLYSYNYLKKHFENENLKIIYHRTNGLLPPEKTPLFFWKIFRFLNVDIPMFGLDHIFILEKQEA